MLDASPFAVHYTKGFTLIELLVAIALLAIFLVFAVPGFNGFLMNRKLEMVVDELQSSLNYARTTALEKNVTTLVCPYNGASTTCGTNWSYGWAVIKKNSDNTLTLIQSNQLNPNSLTVITNSVGQVVFDSQGLASSQTNFTICDSRGGSSATSLTVLPSGYIQSSDKLGQAVWNGASLACN